MSDTVDPNQQTAEIEKLRGILTGVVAVVLREKELFQEKKYEYVANQEWEAASVCRDVTDKIKALLHTIGKIDSEPNKPRYGAECPHCGWQAENAHDKAIVLDACRQHDMVCEKLPINALTALLTEARLLIIERGESTDVPLQFRQHGWLTKVNAIVPVQADKPPA